MRATFNQSGWRLFGILVILLGIATLLVLRNQPTEFQIVVQVQDVRVFNINEVAGSGAIVLHFNVAGESRRFPAAGGLGAITEGDRIAIDQQFVFTLQAGEEFDVIAFGEELDSSFFDEHDDIGRIRIRHRSADCWNSGNHSEASSGGEDSFRLEYRVSVTPLC